MPRSVPIRVRIPAIKVDARLVKIRADADGVLQTPPLDRPEVAGWYADGVSPGEIGPAILAGHVDSNARPAVFYRLRSLHHHDRIFVDREDGSTAVFRVQWIMQVPKKRFPDRKVYGPVKYAALRLITCGGVFDDSTHHYKDNIVVFAQLWHARRAHAHRPPPHHHGHRHHHERRHHHEPLGHESADRGSADRRSADRRSADRESAGREPGGHESADRESADRGSVGRESADRGSADRESAGREPGGHESADRRSADRGSVGRESSGREFAGHESAEGESG